LRHDINFSDCFFLWLVIYTTQKTKMDTALDYVGLAATTGLSAYVLAQLLSGGSANRQLYHGMTMATAIGIATGVGSMVAKAGHDYVLPHIPQADKWKTIELASLNAGMAGAGAWGYVALMDSDVAKADAVPIIGYTNMAPTTFQSAGSIVAGASVTYNIPLSPLSWSSLISSLATSTIRVLLLRYIHKDQESTSLGQSETSLSLPLG